MSIFFDMSIHGEDTRDFFHPKNLTKHYQKEFPHISLDGIYVAAEYVSISSSLEAYKYRSDRQYVSIYVDLLNRLLQQYSIPSISPDDIAITVIPMHWSRYFIRGFDHMALLAKKLSEATGIPYIQPLRARFTQRQSKLSKKQRIKNRSGVYTLKNQKNFPKIIILVDDVISTGSTADACGKLLKSAGVSQVYGIFIASNQ